MKVKKKSRGLFCLSKKHCAIPDTFGCQCNLYVKRLMRHCPYFPNWFSIPNCFVYVYRVFCLLYVYTFKKCGAFYSALKNGGKYFNKKCLVGLLQRPPLGLLPLKEFLKNVYFSFWDKISTFFLNYYTLFFGFWSTVPFKQLEKLSTHTWLKKKFLARKRTKEDPKVRSSFGEGCLSIPLCSKNEKIVH